MEAVDSVRNGAGREPGAKGILSSSIAKSRAVSLGPVGWAPLTDGGSGKSSVEMRGRVPLDEDLIRASDCESARVRTGDDEDLGTVLLTGRRGIGAVLSKEIDSGESGWASDCGESVRARPCRCWRTCPKI